MVAGPPTIGEPWAGPLKPRMGQYQAKAGVEARVITIRPMAASISAFIILMIHLHISFRGGKIKILPAHKTNSRYLLSLKYPMHRKVCHIPL
jgi:hypothetical protein